MTHNPIHQPVFGEAGYDALNAFLKEGRFSSVFLLVDSHTHEHCAPLLLSRLETQTDIEILELEPGEEMKTIDSCMSLWNALNELGADRKSLLINLGGGVITDLGGFVASTFKRGIAFVHVPTTLLAMVDASIGGKNGVDLGALKNQVGLVAQPDLLLIDTEFLETLPGRQMRSGLAEMLKHGLIADAGYWKQLSTPELLKESDMDHLVLRSVDIKNEIARLDPLEKGLRKTLNFGHTLGHAIESHFMEQADKETLLHGEAIAAGMILEAHLSVSAGLLSNEAYQEIRYRLTEIYTGIPLTDPDIEAIIDLTVFDKKNEYGKVLFTLLTGIGSAAIDQTVEKHHILSAFADYRS